MRRAASGDRALKAYRSANPLIWGAILALIIGILAVLGEYWGASKPDNPLLATPAKAAGAAFVMGYAVALFRNWLNERRRGQ